MKNILYIRPPFHWYMPFGTSSSDWTPDRLPEILQPYYMELLRDDVHKGGPYPHLAGFAHPSQQILDAITSHFNQYLHMRLPFWQKSYVWPSDEKGPVRSNRNTAIDHFHCHL